jgi:hypothetical protein
LLDNTEIFIIQGQQQLNAALEGLERASQLKEESGTRIMYFSTSSHCLQLLFASFTSVVLPLRTCLTYDCMTAIKIMQIRILFMLLTVAR